MSGKPESPEIQRIGSIIPDLELPLISGGVRRLQSFLDGKRGGVVLVWSGICSHCVRYDEYLNTFEEKNPGLAFVAIAARANETADDIKKTVAERKLTFPILHSADSSAAALLFAQQTPRAYLVDASRALLYRGAVDNFRYLGDPDREAYLDEAIADFTAGRPIARPEKASFGCAVQTVYYTLPRKMA
jgi:thiol-disulfide isomerase/thioredoxin